MRFALQMHGKERTLAEWRSLLIQGGFAITQLKEIRDSLTSIIECEPV